MTNRLIGASLEERLYFHRKIDEITGCWLWTAQLNKQGYGRITINQRKEKVHRVAYQLFVGKPIDFVLHIRTCPNKNCFNPEHLYDGDRTNNTNDAFTTGAIKRYQGGSIKNIHKTHCVRGHEFTKENTYMYRNSRHCRMCNDYYNQIRRKHV